MRIELPDEQATVLLGTRLAGAIDGPGCIHLEGTLGAGKSTLVRALLRARGVSGAIRSPTYTLVEPYEVDGRPWLHLDLYRLADPEEVHYLGVLDEAGSALLLVEWPCRGRGVLPAPDLVVRLEIAGAGRVARLDAFSASGRLWLDRIGDALARENASPPPGADPAGGSAPI
ncbi:MAG: tRNA (adenosine(37)-N6)-threonylcarbamoyltransferase complex ATPase subunit type 1 TsaE [Halothiobacillaceae bacterium]